MDEKSIEESKPEVIKIIEQETSQAAAGHVKDPIDKRLRPIEDPSWEMEATPRTLSPKAIPSDEPIPVPGLPKGIHTTDD